MKRIASPLFHSLLLACLTALAVPAAVLAQLPQQPEHWDALMAAATKAYEARQFPDAERLYTDALKEAESFGESDVRLASNLNNLGELDRQTGKYPAAESLYKRSLAIWESARGPEDPGVASVANNLGELYRQMSRYADAETQYKRALA
ncbi:MAG: tetratricopeptide repeat protein, partial [Bryobacteraceae bacterium]